MDISIIGTGNVATVLARLIVQNGHSIKQIIGRNEIKGEALANEVNGNFISIKKQVDISIDLCIVALSDSALPEAIAGVDFGNVLVVHTAGAVSMHLLETASTNVGVLYPLQSLRSEMKEIPTIPLLIEASNQNAFNFLETFAKTISTNVQFVEEEKRLRLHLGAVIVSNFTNYLYSVTETFCKAEGVDFNLLKPLIQETANRIENNSPSNTQTGPAKRGDIITLAKHLRLLETHPKLRVLYTRLTDGIMND
jgi:predicted short-subunit dehydrogenase-like oxidoreductase (DUF2520 family)